MDAGSNPASSTDAAPRTAVSPAAARLTAMESVHNFLAFDCGATSGRAVLSSFGKDGIRMEEVYRFPNHPLEIGGKFYWNVYSIYSHILECLSSLGRRGVRLDSIGIDTWGVDFACVAADGSLLGLPRAYRDPYTRGVPEKVFAKVPRRELYDATGTQIMDFNTVFQLYAQTEEGSVALRKAECLLFMPDLLSYLLTGEKVCEYTDASTSGMLGRCGTDFDRGLLERLGIRHDILLPIVSPGTPVGRLRPEIALASGLGRVPVVAVAGHDTASAVAAVPAADENFAYLSSGTWSLMGIEVPEAIVSDESFRLNFTNEGGIEGSTRFLKNITGMWLLEQCRRQWKACGKDYDYDTIANMAQSEAGFSGRIDPDDPRFANPADMLSEIKAVTGDVSDACIVSCVFHSLADRYGEVLRSLQSFAPFRIERLHVIGGGSANDLLNRWTADAVGIPVVAGPVEATAIGNVMMQAYAAGLVKDRWEMRRKIASAFPLKTFEPK